MTALRILIADDHELIRRGVRNMLAERETWTVTEAVDGAAALQLAEQLQPDVAILDISMPRMDGPSLIREMRRVSPSTKSILLTMWDTEDIFLRVMEAGARGYILKSDPDLDVISAVEAVQAGRFFFTMSIADRIVASFLAKGGGGGPEQAAGRGVLTDREAEVISLVAHGLTNKEVASRLNISQRTAETHRNNINRKLKFTSTAQLVRYAFARGLADASDSLSATLTNHAAPSR